MTESPAHTVTLTVLAGALKGRQLVVDEAVDEVLIGSDPDCRLCLDDPGVSPIHARLWVDAEGASIKDTRSAGGVYVNDDRVQDEASLKDGDILWLGAPGEGVMLQFRNPGGRPGAADAAPAVYDAEPEAEQEAEAEPHREPPPVPVAAAPAGEAEDWVIDDGQAAAAGEAEEPVGDVIDDEADQAASDLDWPPAGTAAPVPATPPAMEEAEPEGEDAFFVAADAPPLPSAPAPAPAEEDLFEWTAPPEPAPAPLVVPPPRHAQEEALGAARPAAPPAPATPIEWIDEPSPLAPDAEPEPLEMQGNDYYQEPEPEPVRAPPPPPPPKAAPPAPVAAAPAPPPAPAPAAPERLTSPPPSAPPSRPSRPTGEMGAPRVAPRAAPPAPRGRESGGKRGLMLGIAAAVVVLAGAGFTAMRIMNAPRLDSIEPTRARIGDTIVLQGKNFSSDAASMAVRFEGGKEGRILRAAPTRVEVEVPTVSSAPGRTTQIPVEVVVDGRASKPLQIAVFQAPRVHGISPAVAMPGEEVTLAGSDWAPGATVKFGNTNAEVLEVSPARIRVRVPAVEVAEGTSLPIVVTAGADQSNQVPFRIGRLPLLLGIEPASATTGDTIVVKGLGFAVHGWANDLRIGGARALVVTASENEMKAVVPRTPAPGDNAVELRVPDNERVVQSTFNVTAPPDPVEFRFFAEHPAAAGINDPDKTHDHVMISTGLGPAFMISASEGMSAGERALLFQKRLNEAAVAIKASLTADLEVRGLDGTPSIGLVGKQEPLLTVTVEDAAAYDEDWARGKSKGDQVTPARLAIWWTAVARDLVLLLVRGDKPRYTPPLAAEGKALVTLYDVAHRGGNFGVPREVVASAPVALREGLRVVALRVPATVKGPAGAVGAAAPVSPLALNGTWSGSENEGGNARYMTVTFSGNTGTFTYERALSVTIPLNTVEQVNRKQVRFDLRSGMHLRIYDGTWDGQKLRGKILGDDKSEIGTFEMEHKR